MTRLREIKFERSKFPVASLALGRTQRNQAGGLQPSAVGDLYAPNYSAVQAYDAPDGRHIDHEFEWDGSQGHTPMEVPAGWGIENDIVLHSDSTIVGSRPVCVGGDKDYDYWAGRPENGLPRFWVLEQPSGAALGDADPYFDTINSSDGCGDLTMSIGIGYPKRLNAQSGNPNYWLLRSRIVADPGHHPSSVMHGIFDPVTNDCLGSTATSSCMGLDFDRPFPGPGSDGSWFFNSDRGWRAPGCVSYDTYSGPYYYTEWCGPIW
ncbi:hypothetical protein [Granulicoccus phenolivorans]|uniref:hypothetical protein n=1 Tax=Granulicoccus phenolivorans TaxID=266854 RepID=UPI0011AE8B17|nr:hypothetical protein [Granulicoccus phenolivorans]